MSQVQAAVAAQESFVPASIDADTQVEPIENEAQNSEVPSFSTVGKLADEFIRYGKTTEKISGKFLPWLRTATRAELELFSLKLAGDSKEKERARALANDLIRKERKASGLALETHLNGAILSLSKDGLKTRQPSKGSGSKATAQPAGTVTVPVVAEVATSLIDQFSELINLMTTEERLEAKKVLDGFIKKDKADT